MAYNADVLTLYISKSYLGLLVDPEDLKKGNKEARHQVKKKPKRVHSWKATLRKYFKKGRVIFVLNTTGRPNKLFIIEN